MTVKCVRILHDWQDCPRPAVDLDTVGGSVSTCPGGAYPGHAQEAVIQEKLDLDMDRSWLP